VSGSRRWREVAAMERAPRSRAQAVKPSLLELALLRSSDAAYRLRGFGRVLAVGVALALAATLVGAVPPQATPLWKTDSHLVASAQAAPASTMSVIVRETAPESDAAEQAVRAVGGRITHELSVIGGFSARIPASRLNDVLRSSSILRVWGDGRIHMNIDTSQLNDDTAANRVWQSVIHVRKAQDSGSTGAGVTVALLDTGVSPVADLGNRVLARVDLTPEHDGIDHFGHGTHMAGTIAGDGNPTGNWVGVAPGANLVSVKVAGANGATDVSVVIAGLQWVVNNKDKYGIRVLNLSFGTDSTQTYVTDPLDFAVEQVWFSGITVVVAAGNRGPSGGTVNKPADDPFVISVGAVDLKNSTGKDDDVLASFSSRGPTQDGFTKPGFLAPGVTIVSNRAVGSTIDQMYPDARIGASYFKGTGTSQAAAIVSGIVALMYQANPSLTPDQVKAVLKGTAKGYLVSTWGGGNLVVDAYDAATDARTPWMYPNPNAGKVRSNGLGSLELSRGSLHVYADLPADGLGAQDADGQLDPVTGEVDVLGQPWSASAWSSTGWSATAWSASAWAGIGWEATGWSSTGWSATGWTAAGWSATGWTGASWEATSWSSTGWSATGWSSTGWSSTAWSGAAWSGAAWS